MTTDEIRRWPGQQGTALICTLMVMALVGALGGALVFLVATESMISTNHRVAQQALYAADAGIERAIGDLRTLDDWRDVPGTAAGTATPDFRDGAAAPRLADGTVLDLARLTAERQADSNAGYGASADRPVWRLFAHTPLSRLLPADALSPPAYVVLWIADDVEDGDGDPLRDSNDVLVVRSEAFGLQGTRRRVEVILAREIRLEDVETGADGSPVPGSVRRNEVRMLCWREAQ